MLDHRICDLLRALSLPSLIAAELCHLLIAHDIPYPIRCQDHVPRREVQAVLRIEHELRYLRLSDYASLLGEHVADRSRHGKARIRLIVHPYPERPKLLARLRRSNSMHTLYGLDD